MSLTTSPVEQHNIKNPQNIMSLKNDRPMWRHYYMYLLYEILHVFHDNICPTQWTDMNCLKGFWQNKIVIEGYSPLHGWLQVDLL